MAEPGLEHQDVKELCPGPDIFIIYSINNKYRYILEIVAGARNGKGGGRAGGEQDRHNHYQHR